MVTSINDVHTISYLSRDSSPYICQYGSITVLYKKLTTLSKENGLYGSIRAWEAMPYPRMNTINSARNVKISGS